MLGKTIKQYLENNGIKQSFLCEQTGLSKDVISSICNGTRKLEAYEYYKICRALNVDQEKFMAEIEGRVENEKTN